MSQVKTIRFERTWPGLVGFLVVLAGYVLIAFNAPWWVTLVAILLSVRWEVSGNSASREES